jgi:hypothetical protein
MDRKDQGLNEMGGNKSHLKDLSLLKQSLKST